MKTEQLKTKKNKFKNFKEKDSDILNQMHPKDFKNFKAIVMTSNEHEISSYRTYEILEIAKQITKLEFAGYWNKVEPFEWFSLDYYSEKQRTLEISIKFLDESINKNSNCEFDCYFGSEHETGSSTFIECLNKISTFLKG